MAQGSYSELLPGNKTQTQKRAGERLGGLWGRWKPCSQGALALNPSTLAAYLYVLHVSVFSSENGVVISVLHTVKARDGLCQRPCTNEA